MYLALALCLLVQAALSSEHGTVLIIGVAGRHGRQFVHRCAALNMTILGVDNVLHGASGRSLKEQMNNMNFFLNDFRNAKFMEKLFAGYKINTIFHLAVADSNLQQLRRFVFQVSRYKSSLVLVAKTRSIQSRLLAILKLINYVKVRICAMDFMFSASMNRTICIVPMFTNHKHRPRPLIRPPRSIDINNISYYNAKTSRSLFIFGITHEKNSLIAHAAQRAWGLQAAVWWYSTAPDALLKATVITVPQGSSYDMITFRVRAIWADVYRFHDGYDWYVRCWDDNFLVLPRIRLIADQLQPWKPVVVGRIGHFLDIKFVGGGASSLMSRAALHKWAEYAGATFDGCDMHLSCISCEDVIFSRCQELAGIIFLHAYGFHAQSFHHPEVNLTIEQLSHGHIAAEDRGINNLFGDRLSKTFHYVSVQDMLALSSAYGSM